MSTPSLKDSLKLNTPRRTPNHKTKSHVVKINDNGTERMIRFGQQGVSGDKEPTSRQSSFKARHKKNIDKGPTSAAYWANKVKWAEGGSVGYDSDRIDAMAEEILNFAEGGYVGRDEMGLATSGRDRAQDRPESGRVPGTQALDLTNDGRVDYVDLVEALRPTAPQEFKQMAQDIASLIDKDEFAKATALTAMMGASVIPFGRSATSPVRRSITKDLNNTPEVVDTSVVMSEVAPKVPATPKSKDVKVEADPSPDYSKARKEELDPLKYSQTKLDKPFDEVEFESQQMVKLDPKKTVNVEDLEGKIAIPLYGDRSSLGEKITSVEDIKLDRSVITEGGRDFMRGKATGLAEMEYPKIPNDLQQSEIWASKQSIITRLFNRAKEEAGDTDVEIIGVTGSMAPKALDFNNFTPELLAEMTAVTLTQGNISKKALSVFDDLMRTHKVKPKDGDFKAVEDWPGITSPNLREYIRTATPKTRKKFMSIMEMTPAQEAGFPLPGKARIATTDKSQLYTPPGMFGGSIAKLDLERGVVKDPLNPHFTYDTQFGGTYLGGLPQEVHQSLMFPSLYKSREGILNKQGKPESEANISASVRTKVPGQKMTPEVIDNIMMDIERRERGYSEGGEVGEVGEVGTSFFDVFINSFNNIEFTGGEANAKIAEEMDRIFSDTSAKGFNRGDSYDADKINMMADQILETYNV